MGRAGVPDLGLTHVALSVRDLDASISFYAKYAGMAVVHRRAHDGVRSVWLTDRTRPFVIVLVDGAGKPDPPLGPFGHLGVACKSREEIDRLYAEAHREGRPTRAPTDLGEPSVMLRGSPTPTATRSNCPSGRRSGSRWGRRPSSESAARRGSHLASREVVALAAWPWRVRLEDAIPARCGLLIEHRWGQRSTGRDRHDPRACGSPY